MPRHPRPTPSQSKQGAIANTVRPARRRWLPRKSLPSIRALPAGSNGSLPRSSTPTPVSTTGPLPAKDLVDFVLVRQHARVEAKRLKDAIQRTFACRGTHPIPEHLPQPPPELAIAYRREAEVVGVVTSLEEVHKLAVQWLNPVLACTARGSWDPGKAQWAE